MLNEDKQCMKPGCDIEHESSVLCEPFDVAFVPGVDKDRGGMVGALVPVGGVHEVLLVEDLVCLWLEGEVV